MSGLASGAALSQDDVDFFLGQIDADQARHTAEQNAALAALAAQDRTAGFDPFGPPEISRKKADPAAAAAAAAAAATKTSSSSSSSFGVLGGPGAKTGVGGGVTGWVGTLTPAMRAAQAEKAMMEAAAAVARARKAGTSSRTAGKAPAAPPPHPRFGTLTPAMRAARAERALLEAATARARASKAGMSSKTAGQAPAAPPPLPSPPPPPSPPSPPPPPTRTQRAPTRRSDHRFDPLARPKGTGTGVSSNTNSTKNNTKNKTDSAAGTSAGGNAQALPDRPRPAILRSPRGAAQAGGDPLLARRALLTAVYDPRRPPPDDPVTAEGVAMGVVPGAPDRLWREQAMRIGRWCSATGQAVAHGADELAPHERAALDVWFRRRRPVVRRVPLRGGQGRGDASGWWRSRSGFVRAQNVLRRRNRKVPQERGELDKAAAATGQRPATGSGAGGPRPGGQPAGKTAVPVGTRGVGAAGATGASRTPAGRAPPGGSATAPTRTGGSHQPGSSAGPATGARRPGAPVATKHVVPNSRAPGPFSDPRTYGTSGKTVAEVLHRLSSQGGKGLTTGGRADAPRIVKPRHPLDAPASASTQAFAPPTATEARTTPAFFTGRPGALKTAVSKLRGDAPARGRRPAPGAGRGPTGAARTSAGADLSRGIASRRHYRPAGSPTPQQKKTKAVRWGALPTEEELGKRGGSGIRTGT